MRNQIQSFTRKHLHPRLRQPLGWVAGFIYIYVVRPLLGFWFDMTGGRFKADGCAFVIPKDVTSMAYRSCFVTGEYEADERELIRSQVRADDQVLELGACLGIVSCVTNRLLRDKSRHVVVEGNPFCIPTLHRNRALNQCGFLIENCAVSNERDALFYLHPVYVVGGTTQRSTNLPVRVPCRTLRGLHERYGPFTVLIIDVEGSELDVFEASRDVLHQYRLVIAELHDWAIGNEGVERCRQILGELGFRPVGRAGITEAWQRD